MLAHSSGALPTSQLHRSLNMPHVPIMKRAHPSVTLGTTEPEPRERAVRMGSGVHRQDREARKTTAAAALRAWSRRPGEMTAGTVEAPGPMQRAFWPEEEFGCFLTGGALGRIPGATRMTPLMGQEGLGFPPLIRSPFLPFDSLKQ